MTDAAPGKVTYLIEWWETGGNPVDRLGHWIECDDASVARERALGVVDDAWTTRVRMTLLSGAANVAAVDSDRSALQTWDVASGTLPRASDGPDLPPRSCDDIRGEVLNGCRDALSLALRARLIDRSRVLRLLFEVDRSFDAGSLDDDRAA